MFQIVNQGETNIILKIILVEKIISFMIVLLSIILVLVLAIK